MRSNSKIVKKKSAYKEKFLKCSQMFCVCGNRRVWCGYFFTNYCLNENKQVVHKGQKMPTESNTGLCNSLVSS